MKSSPSNNYQYHIKEKILFDSSSQTTTVFALTHLWYSFVSEAFQSSIHINGFTFLWPLTCIPSHSFFAEWEFVPPHSQEELNTFYFVVNVHFELLNYLCHFEVHPKFEFNFVCFWRKVEIWEQIITVIAIQVFLIIIF